MTWGAGTGPHGYCLCHTEYGCPVHGEQLRREESERKAFELRAYCGRLLEQVNAPYRSSGRP